MDNIWLVPETKAAAIAKKLQAYEGDEISDYNPSRWDYQYEVINRVAVLPITDILQPTSRWSQSTVNIGREILRANKDEEVDSIFLWVDCPGGAAAKVSETASIIYNSEKPIIGFCESAESGGYWLVSQTEYVIAADDAGMKTIGNIGGVIYHKEISKQLEMDGVTITVITADKSTDKGLGNPYQPLSKVALNSLKEELNTLVNDYFIPAVQKGRGKKLKVQGDEPFTAKSYNAQEALEFGLIDKIGTAQDAFAKAVALGKKQQNQQNSNNFSNPYMSAFKTWFDNMKSIFSKMPDVEDKPAESTAQAAANLAPASDPLADLAAKVATMQTSIDTTVAALTAKDEEAEKLKAKIATLEAENAKLALNPAALPTVATEATGDLLTNKEENVHLDDETKQRIDIMKFAQEAKSRSI